MVPPKVCRVSCLSTWWLKWRAAVALLARKSQSCLLQVPQSWHRSQSGEMGAAFTCRSPGVCKKKEKACPFEMKTDTEIIPGPERNNIENLPREILLPRIYCTLFPQRHLPGPGRLLFWWAFLLKVESNFKWATAAVLQFSQALLCCRPKDRQSFHRVRFSECTPTAQQATSTVCLAGRYRGLSSLLINARYLVDGDEHLESHVSQYLYSTWSPSEISDLGEVCSGRISPLFGTCPGHRQDRVCAWITVDYCTFARA